MIIRSPLGKCHSAALIHDLVLQGGRVATQMLWCAPHTEAVITSHVKSR